MGVPSCSPILSSGPSLGGHRAHPVIACLVAMTAMPVRSIRITRCRPGADALSRAAPNCRRRRGRARSMRRSTATTSMPRDLGHGQMTLTVFFRLTRTRISPRSRSITVSTWLCPFARAVRSTASRQNSRPASDGIACSTRTALHPGVRGELRQRHVLDAIKRVERGPDEYLRVPTRRWHWMYRTDGSLGYHDRHPERRTQQNALFGAGQLVQHPSDLPGSADVRWCPGPSPPPVRLLSLREPRRRQPIRLRSGPRRIAASIHRRKHANGAPPPSRVSAPGATVGRVRAVLKT